MLSIIDNLLNSHGITIVFHNYCVKLIPPSLNHVIIHKVPLQFSFTLLSRLQCLSLCVRARARLSLVPRCLIRIGANALLPCSSQGAKGSVSSTCSATLSPGELIMGSSYPLAAYHQEFLRTFHSRHPHRTRASLVLIAFGDPLMCLLFFFLFFVLFVVCFFLFIELNSCIYDMHC